MRTVPKGRIDRIAFYEARVSKWAAHAAEIGTSDERVALLAAKTAEARQALGERQQAKDAARSATLRFNLAVREMRQIGAGIMQQIRCKASSGGGGDSVYVLASIPAPAKKTKLPPPGRPYGFAIDLQASGALTLTWKCDNPRGSQGTSYLVSRRIGAGGNFVNLGLVGRRKFIDQTLPAGASSVTYQVQAMRSTASGEVAQFEVNFGASGQALPAVSTGTARRAA